MCPVILSGQNTLTPSFARQHHAALPQAVEASRLSDQRQTFSANPFSTISILNCILVYVYVFSGASKRDYNY